MLCLVLFRQSYILKLTHLKLTHLTDADAEAPILWPPNVKSQLIGKYPVAGKNWRQEEKEQQRLDSIIYTMDMSLSKLLETMKDSEVWCAAVYGVTKNQTQLSD